MALSKNDKLVSLLLKQSLSVIKPVGEGGEGVAYLVETPDLQKEVVKWYHSNRIVPGHKQGIEDLVKRGPPRGSGGKRFVWPKDLVVEEGNSVLYGYRMDLIDTTKFVELTKIWANRHPQPSFKNLCEISFKIADSFSDLHLSGYCYKDISLGNLLINSEGGDVLICDNDNIGVDGNSDSVMQGTTEFMAPEVICGETVPSTSTDKHSLAVLLFYLWMWHHPLEGKKEYQIRVWDIPAKKKIYGESPLFVFDPEDDSNGLIDSSGYKTCFNRWKTCPPRLQEAFTNTFTRGLKNPSSRVTEGRWKSIFQTLSDNITLCRCGAENLWTDGDSVYCWNCDEHRPAPSRFELLTPSGNTDLLFKENLKFLGRHIGFDDINSEAVVAEVTPHPERKGVYGLRNHTERDWILCNDQGHERKPLPPGKSARLSAGMKVDVGRGVSIHWKE